MRMSNERRAMAFKAMETRHEIERVKGSTAEKFDFSAKSVETYLRDFLYNGGLRNESDFRARGVKTVDIRINGKACEVKTGGSIGYADSNDWGENDILPNCYYVAFPVMTEIKTLDDLYDNTAVITRGEFIELLERASRKGLHGAAHYIAKRGVIAFQPVPLEKVRGMVMEGLADGSMISFRTIKECGIE